MERTFGVVVPRLAAQHSPLLNAILAVSSKHLSILTGQNVLAAGRYYQECLGALIPLLNDESAVMNDVILAVIVILRLIEELECVSTNKRLIFEMLTLSQQRLFKQPHLVTCRELENVSVPKGERLLRADSVIPLCALWLGKRTIWPFWTCAKSGGI